MWFRSKDWTGLSVKMAPNTTLTSSSWLKRGGLALCAGEMSLELLSGKYILKCQKLVLQWVKNWHYFYAIMSVVASLLEQHNRLICFEVTNALQ